MTLSLTYSETFDFSDYNDYNDYNDCNDYNDFNDYNDYSDYHDYSHSDLDLNLDLERFSELVT